jgi:hypothetical protein
MRTSTTVPTLSSPLPLSSSAAEACPLNHGVAVVDQLLAAITRASEFDAHALDVALDFRLLLASSTDAEDILQAFFRVRAAVEENHYLACFRLRRWLEIQFAAHVRPDRTQPIREVPIRLTANSYRELCARCAFDAAGNELVSPWVRVHFVTRQPHAVATSR